MSPGGEMIQKFADIHVHSTLKPFNNCHVENKCPKPFDTCKKAETCPTLWEELPLYGPNNPDPFKKVNPIIRSQIDIFRKSQANLDQCVKANLRCAFLGLYPAERKFFDAREICVLDLFIKIILPKWARKYVGAAVTGFPVWKVKKIIERIEHDAGIDYFNEEFLKLIKYVVKQQDVQSPTNQYKFKIATDYEDFENYTEQEKKIITGILTVEGVSSLGNYRYHKIFDKTYSKLTPIEKAELAIDFEANIKTTKNLNKLLNTRRNYTPFFISFSHHFNNLLAGHSKSLASSFSLLLNQKPGMDAPFNRLGFKVLHLLLSRENGRRILIDTKHMSILSRRQYHCFVKKRRLKGDNIPIICSHSAVNGLESFKKAGELEKKKCTNKKSYFSSAALNLNDEEILDIYDSDGLIGIVLHEDRMPGDDVKRELKKYKPCKILVLIRELFNIKSPKADKRLRSIYIRLIWSNIFHIIRLISKKRLDNRGQKANGWKILSLGSDFDGTMNPFDTYETAEDFPRLAEDMIAYLINNKNPRLHKDYPIYYADKGERKPFARTDIINLSFGGTPTSLVIDIFWNNTSKFLKKYFHDGYLKR